MASSQEAWLEATRAFDAHGRANELSVELAVDDRELASQFEAAGWLVTSVVHGSPEAPIRVPSLPGGPRLMGFEYLFDISAGFKAFVRMRYPEWVPR
ncbi:MAG: hypothetical protein H7288_22945 [Kineosporiaceae bacterium]|nr:hypothetical protein [Aeromicrobium sp.]